MLRRNGEVDITNGIGVGRKHPPAGCQSYSRQDRLIGGIAEGNGEDLEAIRLGVGWQARSEHLTFGWLSCRVVAIGKEDDTVQPRLALRLILCLEFPSQLSRPADSSVEGGVATSRKGTNPPRQPFGDIADSLACEDQFRNAFLMGCVGAWSLHPSQIEIARRVFSPPPDEVLWAKQVIEAMGDGTGTIMLEGKMQDDATVKQCKVMVSYAELIAKRDPELAEQYGMDPAKLNR